jgi:hypothetical protein
MTGLLAATAKRPDRPKRQLFIYPRKEPASRLSAHLQPLIVFVLHSDAKDPTRPPAFYDETYAFLVSCGIPEI